MITNIIILSSIFFHEFYSSITTIEYRFEKKKYEIVGKYFENDFIKYAQDFIPDYTLDKKYNSQLRNYLESEFTLKLNKQQIKTHFVGFVKQNDIVVLLFESEETANNGDLDVKNNLLLKHFKDQINIIQLKQNTYRKTEIISNHNKVVSFKTPLDNLD